MISIQSPKVRPCSIPIHHMFTPSNKYEANRLLLISALANGRSVITDIPFNEDIQMVVSFLSSQHDYNYEISYRRPDENQYDLVLNQLNKITNRNIYVSSNGSFARFISPMLLLYTKKYWFFNQSFILDGSDQMRKRPMYFLFEAMKMLGAKITYQQKHGFLPVKITGSYVGGECSLPGHISSQYFSALLLSAPYAKKDVTIRATSPLVSESHINTTIKYMREYGAKVDKIKSQYGMFRVVGGQKKVYKAFKKKIKIDPTAISYFMAMVALNFIHLRVHGFSRRSPQGEFKFYKILEQLGCKVKLTHSEGECLLDVLPPSGLRPSKIKLNMISMPDTVPTMLSLAVALGHRYDMETTIIGIDHLRHKESNRVEGMCGELQKLGATIDITDSKMVVHPKKLKKSDKPLDSLGDHRLVMSFSILSLVIGEVIIKNETCVNKSFPLFFDELRKLDFICDKRY